MQICFSHYYGETSLPAFQFGKILSHVQAAPNSPAGHQSSEEFALGISFS
jgi:hypothetical protein